MAKSRLVGQYPVIGIRPTIDGRKGILDVRGSLEEQTMNMAKSAAELLRSNIKYSNGESVKVVIADTTIGRVAESAACADKFRREGVDITLTVTPCWCYGAETMDMDPMTIINNLYMKLKIFLMNKFKKDKLKLSLPYYNLILDIQLYKCV